VLLTLPLTGLTLGLFYPFINVFILNIVDFILGDYFTINGIFMAVIVSIFISIMNMMMDRFVYDTFIEKGRY
ncbi:MAG: phage holin family protein, partial [Bacilli bacterium]|nr:phage holin family protein [Bacilli bacterium]